MLSRSAAIVAAMMICVAACLLAAHARNASEPPLSWNQKAAAGYLDGREVWWMNWPRAARDHQTFCVSCHTILPYALSRPTLHSALAETSASVNEQKLVDNVTTRVRLWKEVEPWYSDEKVGIHKTRESRGTESILNALILSSRDAE